MIWEASSASILVLLMILKTSAGKKQNKLDVKMTELRSANVVQLNNQLILEKNRSNNIEEYKTNPSDIIKKIKIVHI